MNKKNLKKYLLLKTIIAHLNENVLCDLNSILLALFSCHTHHIRNP